MVLPMTATSPTATTPTLAAIADAPARARAWLGSRAAENALTAITVGAGAVLTSSGMWRFSRDKLETTGPALPATFAFIELAELVFALRARRHRIKHGTGGVDDLFVWVTGATTGLLGAFDTPTWTGKIGRFVIALVGAFLIHRAAIAEADDAADTPDRRAGRVRRLTQLMYALDIAGRPSRWHQRRRLHRAIRTTRHLEDIANARQATAVLHNAGSAATPVATEPAPNVAPDINVPSGAPPEPVGAAQRRAVPTGSPRTEAVPGSARRAAYRALKAADPTMTAQRAAALWGISDRSVRAVIPADER